MIKSSLDWEQSRRQELKQKILNLPYNRDLRNMLKNVDTMIVTLSKAEVNARRNHKKIENLTELQAVNDAIITLEKWIVMAALIG